MLLPLTAELLSPCRVLSAVLYGLSHLQLLQERLLTLWLSLTVYECMSLAGIVCCSSVLLLVVRLAAGATSAAC